MINFLLSTQLIKLILFGGKVFVWDPSPLSLTLPLFPSQLFLLLLHFVGNVSVFSLDQFCSKSPPKAPIFDHFLELWVYAKQFIFGGLFIILFYFINFAQEEEE